MLQVSESEIKNRLQIDNPWWAEGKVPARFRDMPKRAYLPGLISLMTETRVRRAVVLLGPRRVGKTVMLYQTIQDQIDHGVDPKVIFYVSVDNPVYTGLTLEKLLQLFLELHGHKPKSNHLIIFDEIQYHPDWERHLKSLVDSYPRFQFAVSGSAAAALRMKSVESGAGRFTDFLLPPLSFAEFLNFTNRAPKDDDKISDEVLAQLNGAFIEYLNYGGFPEAVMIEPVRQQMDRYVADDIIDKVLLRDLPSLYGIGDTQELKRLFNVLAYNTGQEVNLEGLSQASGVAKNTLRKYLEYLEAAFLIHRLYRIDQNARHFKRATHFKIYLTNPCLRSALFGPVAAEDNAMGHMAETAYISQIVQSDVIEHCFYARWPAGEVDFIRLDRAHQKAVSADEIKWSNRVIKDSATELAALVSFCVNNQLKEARVHTRSVMSTLSVSGIKIECIPISVMCFVDGKVLVGDKINEGQHPRSFAKVLMNLRATRA